MKTGLVTKKNNISKVKTMVSDQSLVAMEKCGLIGEAYAKQLCPVGTGNLRNSITYRVAPEEPAVYNGTNCEYAAYVECGTGNGYDGSLGGGGRQTIAGQRPQPYLRPAVADHEQMEDLVNRIRRFIMPNPDVEDKASQTASIINGTLFFEHVLDLISYRDRIPAKEKVAYRMEIIHLLLAMKKAYGVEKIEIEDDDDGFFASISEQLREHREKYLYEGNRYYRPRKESDD